jgi:hypothetical protein
MFEHPHRILTENDDTLLTLRYAEAGYPDAQYQVAMFLANQSNLKPDPDKTNFRKASLAWLKKSASESHPPALYTLADCYLQGVGVPVDIGKALRLYAAAAQVSSYPIEDMAIDMIREINQPLGNRLDEEFLPHQVRLTMENRVPATPERSLSW